MQNIKILQAVVIVLALAFCVAIGYNFSLSGEIETFESIIAKTDSLQMYKKAVNECNAAGSAWQSTAYAIIDFNAGKIDSDSVLALIQFHFVEGSGITDRWLRAIKAGENND